MSVDTLQVIPLNSTVAVFGECMLELSLATTPSLESAVPANFSFGGDTLNMSVYLSRMGAKVEYITALGDDTMSDWLIECWQSEQVGCEHVFRQLGRVPGLYLIELDEHGERSFRYWRKDSPAAQILNDSQQAQAVFDAISNYPILFLSGISVAILSPEAQQLLIEFLGRYRDAGGKVVFDCNHRPTLWQSPEEAMQIYQQLYRVTDIALPTFDDEATLFGYESPEVAMTAIAALGVSEIVLKMGEQGCFYDFNGQRGFVPVTPVYVIDTTSAGDSFNAGYLSQRVKGAGIEEACRVAHQLASTVVQHKGAIIAKEEMPFS